MNPYHALENKICMSYQDDLFSLINGNVSVPILFFFKRRKLLSKLVPHSMYESGRVPSLNWFPMTRGYQSNRVSKQSLQSRKRFNSSGKDYAKIGD